MTDVIGKRSDQIGSGDAQSPSDGRRYANRTTAERRAERRDRLIETAVETFARRGYRNASIEQLCADANISTRNFYEEFASKEQLLAETHDIVNRRTLGAVVEAIGRVDAHDIEAIATAGVGAYFEAMTSDRRWARIALVETVGVSAEMEAHRRAALDNYAAVITVQGDALAAADLIPTRDYGLTALALVGAIQELVTMAVNRDEASGFDDVAAEATRLVVVALRDPRVD